MITAEFEKERKRMKEELKKSLRTYGALLLLGVTGVPLGAAVGLIEALFCRCLLYTSMCGCSSIRKREKKRL